MKKNGLITKILFPTPATDERGWGQAFSKFEKLF